MNKSVIDDQIEWKLVVKQQKLNDNSHCANGICALHVMVRPEGSDKLFPALLTLKHEDHDGIKNEIFNKL